jgi:hypothetical protein
MNRLELPRLQFDVDEAARHASPSLGEANLRQRFDPLLDEEDSLVDDGDVEEVLRNFLVSAAPHQQTTTADPRDSI